MERDKRFWRVTLLALPLGGVRGLRDLAAGELLLLQLHQLERLQPELRLRRAEQLPEDLHRQAVLSGRDQHRTVDDRGHRPAHGAGTGTRPPDRQPRSRLRRLQVHLLSAHLPLGGRGGADLGMDLPAGLGTAEHGPRSSERRTLPLRVARQARYRALVGDRRLVVAADRAVDGDLSRRTHHHPRRPPRSLRDRGRHHGPAHSPGRHSPPRPRHRGGDCAQRDQLSQGDSTSCTS